MNDDPKSYTLTFEERPQYLYARVAARAIDRENATAYLTEVAQRVSKSGMSKLLLYRDIPAMLDDAALFHVTQEFLQMIRGVKAAFVNPHIQNTSSMEFAMTVGKNRGGNYQAFSDISDAEAWLLSDNS